MCCSHFNSFSPLLLSVTVTEHFNSVIIRIFQVMSHIGNDDIKLIEYKGGLCLKVIAWGAGCPPQAFIGISTPLSHLDTQAGKFKFNSFFLQNVSYTSMCPFISISAATIVVRSFSHTQIVVNTPNCFLALPFPFIFDHVID